MLERRIQIAANVRDDAEVLLDAADECGNVARHGERLPKELRRVHRLSRFELKAAERVERFRRERRVVERAGDIQTLFAQLVGDATLELSMHHHAQSPERFRLRRCVVIGNGRVDRSVIFLDGECDASRALVVTSVAKGASRRGRHHRGRHVLG